jgi:hypothetical protein
MRTQHKPRRPDPVNYTDPDPGRYADLPEDPATGLPPVMAAICEADLAWLHQRICNAGNLTPICCCPLKNWRRWINKFRGCCIIRTRSRASDST